MCINLLSVNLTNRSNTLKKLIGNSQRIFLDVFEHFVGFALKGSKVI